MQIQITQSSIYNSLVSYKASKFKQTDLEDNTQFGSFFNYTQKEVVKSEANQYINTKQVPYVSTEQAIERSGKIQEFFTNDYEEFRLAKLEYWANKDNPDYEPPEKYAKYLEQIKNVDPCDIILDGKLVRLPLNEFTHHHGLYETKDIELDPKAQIYRGWNYQFTIQTPSNKYENAPEFESFINKWKDKGLSEDQALYRAAAYAELGLLDYGNQRAVRLYNLPFGDKKQHGFHLIDNPVLKETVLETFNTLDNSDILALRAMAFMPHEFSSLNPEEKPDLNFQNLLDIFASIQKKSPSLKGEYKDLIFDGNINITDGMNFLERNFVYDNITAFFKLSLDDLYEGKKKEPDSETLDNNIKLLETLINNFEKNVKVSNESSEEKLSMLKYYMGNNRFNPLQNYN